MRVAHFVQRYPPARGGAEAYFARLGGWLARQGDQVTVFTTTALELEAFWRRRGRCLPAGVSREDGVEVRRYGLLRWPGRRWILKPISLIPHRPWQCLTLPCNPLAWEMWRAAGRDGERFDLVHATAFPYTFPIACGLRLARRQGIPFLLTPFLHLGDPADLRDPTRLAYLAPPMMHLLRAADRVFVQTELERLALRDQGLPEEKLVLLGMGVAPAECAGGDRELARRQWGVTDEVVIGHLANLSVEKGTVDLLQAGLRLADQGLRFRLVLAGPAMGNFRTFWERCSLRQRVTCLGEIDDEQKRHFFAGIDLFALPSRSDSFGLVLLEAWSNGLANVVYRAGGPAEVVRHEQDGLLARCGDVAELADHLQRLIGDPELRQRLGETGQARTSAEFRWEDKLRRVHAVYQEVLRS